MGVGGRTPRRDWTTPGAFEVAQGVFRIPLPLPLDGLRAVNVYAIETEHGITLVDGGWAVAEARLRLENSLREIGYRISDIERILVTHMHRDHYTQALELRREFGVQVVLGIGEMASLDAILGNAVDPDPQCVQLASSGADEIAAAWLRGATGLALEDATWEYPDEWLSGDMTLYLDGRTVEAVATPGHTQGHLVFADTDAGLLFSGDHVLPGITPSIGFEPVLASLPLRDFLDSLVKVRDLPDLMLLPAHGGVTQGSHARVEELLAHHEERLTLCRQAVQSGAASPYDVAKLLPWTRHRKRLRDLDDLGAGLAVLETLAHLELLHAQGEVDREVFGELLRFHTPASFGAHEGLPTA